MYLTLLVCNTGRLWELVQHSSISNLQLPKFILGNFATVQEVQEALNNGSFPLVFDQKVNLPGIDTVEIHYTIYDKTGAGIIIESLTRGEQFPKTPSACVPTLRRMISI